jgi:ABC-type transport system substrate-binding protein
LGYYAGKDNPHYSQSRAHDELARCPGRTLPVEVTYPTIGAFENESKAIEGMLAGIGMNAKLKPVSGGDWANTILAQPLDKTNTQIVYVAYSQDYPDPSNYFANLLPPARGVAIGGWYDRVYERLVNRAAVTFNQKTRASFYIRAQHIAFSQGAFVSVSEGLSSFLIKPYVHGLTLSQDLNLVAKNNDWANVSITKH